MPEIVKSNPTNSPTEKPVKNHSKFQPNYSRYDTHVFGINTPHFVMEAVADDDISLRAAADVDTFNLKAPLMQPVKRNMDYFQLPLRALLPHGAELLITNPLQGDDIDARKVNAILYKETIDQVLTTLSSILDKSENDLDRIFADLVGAYQYYHLLLAKGSLPKYLGYSFDELINPEVGTVKTISQGNYGIIAVTLEDLFDAAFAAVDAAIAEGGVIEFNLKTLEVEAPYGAQQFSPSTKSLYCCIGTPNYSAFEKEFATVREFLAWMLVNPYVIQSDVNSSGLVNAEIFGDLSSYEGAVDSYSPGLMMAICYARLKDLMAVTLSLNVTTAKKDENLLRILAYQMASAEFYTNDKVDGIYSAALFLSNQIALGRYTSQLRSSQVTYTVNGVPVEYDAHSGQILNLMINRLCIGISSALVGLQQDDMVNFCYVHNLFSYTRSLKYEDYFVGSKTRPLAVGDVNVAVSGSNVDIIDVTKKIQLQRFLNQVNRIGRKFSDYVKGILGDKPMKDIHEPIFLGHVADTFGAEETDNTGEAQMSLQNSTTSKLRNNSSRYAFDVHVGEPSVIIGITNYDIPRAYSTVTERQNFHVDRFDMFNPYMQNVGDQEVYGEEILPGRSTAFGYQLRHSEYKQRVDQAAGGFAAKQLPGYARVLTRDDIPESIDSDFLRSDIYEIDQFYSVLSGYTLATHFNFIVRTDISCSAKRPMSFAPSIL